MKYKKLLAAALSVFMIGGAFADYSPIVKDSTLTADAVTTSRSINGVNYIIYDGEYACVVIPGIRDFNYTSIEKEIEGAPVTQMMLGSDGDICGGNNPTTFPYGFEVYDGAVYSLDKDGKKEKLLICPVSKTSIVLPEGLKSFNKQAFYETNIYKIEIPDSVTDIPYRCFCGCNNLKEITIPNTIKSIGENSFLGCNALTSVTILNPDCKIDSKCGFGEYRGGTNFDCIIRGYDESTTFYYARKYSNLTFKSLGELYNISVVSDNSSYGTTTSTFRCGKGQKAKIVATPNKGYKFGYWLDKDGKKYTSNPLTITAAKDTVYTAYFIPSTYTVKAESSDTEKGTVTGGGTFDESEKTELIATAVRGYKFDHWEEANGGKYSANPLKVVGAAGSSCSFTAYFVDARCTVGVRSQNDMLGTVSGGGKDIIEGDKVTLTATPAENVSFVKWVDNDGKVYTDNPLTIRPEKDMAFMAYFKAGITGISLVPEGTKYTITEAGGSYNVAMTNTIKLTAAPVPSHINEFNGIRGDKWLIDGTASSSHGKFTADANGTTALEADKYYKIVYFCPKAQGNGIELSAEYITDSDETLTSSIFVNISDSTGKIKLDKAVAEDVTVQKGSKAEGVKVVATPAKPYIYNLKFSTMTPNAPKITFDTNTYTLSVDAADAENGVYEYFAYDGARQVEGGLRVSVYSPCTISFDANGGSGTMSDISSVTGKTFKLPKCDFEAPSGTVFDGWDIGGTKYAVGDTIELEGDVALKAVWAKVVIIGDANDDSVIDKIDDVLLARYTSGWKDVTVNEAVCDINNDGTVDLVDSVILSRYIAGWEDYKAYFAS